VATRTRAVWALAAVGGPTADGFFLHTLATEDVEPPVLAAVLESFVESSRAREPARASKVATEHLTHGEPMVRLAAARALERLASPPAGGSPSRPYPSPPK